MYHNFYLQTFYVLPTQYIYVFVWISEQTAIVVRFILGNSPASECYMLTFRNTLLHLHRQVAK
jgi:hypothetical protein